MTTVIIQPRTLEEVESDTELVQLRILTGLYNWQSLYDLLEVWRSKRLPQGPYEELTGDGWLPARIPANAADQPAIPPVTVPSAVLTGTELKIRVDDNQDYTITFTGPDPVSYNDAVLQVNAAAPGIFSAYLTSESEFVLEGVRPGTGATLEVTGGDAAPLLGLSIDSPENYGRGKDSRLALIVGKEEYTFIDPLGSRLYYYKTRFRNHITGAISDFSIAFSVGQSPGISSANIVSGYINLVRSDGHPLQNQRVQVYAPTQMTLVEQKVVTGYGQSKFTDTNGRVEFTLIRGVEYMVSVAGTDIVCNILAPVDPSVRIFNLLDGSVTVDADAFKAQAADPIYASRRSL